MERGRAANAGMLKRLGYKIAGPHSLPQQVQTWNDWRAQCPKCKRPRIGTVRELTEEPCKYCGHRSERSPK